MKKIASFLLVLIIFSSIICPAHAYSGSDYSAYAGYYDYYIAEAGISISISDEYHALTRNTPEYDYMLRDLGYTLEEWLDYMVESGTHIDAITYDYTSEITFLTAQSYFPEFSSLPNYMVKALCVPMCTYFIDLGYENTSLSFYENGQAKFAVLHFKYEDGLGPIEEKLFMTSHDNSIYTFTLIALDGEISEEEEDLFLNTIDSIRFDIPAPAPEIKESGSFTYHDDSTGVEYLVPANWTFTDVKVRDSYTITNFTYGDGISTLGILSADFWDELPWYEKLFISKKNLDIDNYDLPEDDIEELLGEMFPSSISTEDGIEAGIEISHAEKTELDGRKYISADMLFICNFAGIQAEIPASLMALINEGTLYMYICLGSRSDEYYADLVSLIRSADYSGAGKSSWGISTVLILLAVVFICVIILAVIIRKRERRLADDAAESKIHSASPGHSAPDICTDAEFLCKKCGKKNPEDSIFCQYCGNKLN